MIERFAAQSLILILGLYTALPLRATEPAVRPTVTDLPLLSTNGLRSLHPGPLDDQIASVTARMLERYHYLRLRLDDSLSSRFFDRYFETLDPMHLYFTQGDLAEFEHYRTNLSRLTVDPKRRGLANTTPAYEIFNRYLERVAQRVAYAEDLLQHDKFTFDTDERITINRKDMPYPTDLDEAKKLWRQRLRFEYLQELLGKIDARKKKLATAKEQTPLSAETNAPVEAPQPMREAGTNAAASPAVSLSTAAAPAITKEQPPRVLPSPKDSERVAALQSSASVPHAKAEAEVRATAEQEKPRAKTQAGVATPTNQISATLPKKTDDEEIIETLSHRYHRNLRFFKDWNSDDVLQVYLTALARVYDPHSDYLGHAQLEQFSIGMNLSLFGIGAELLSEDGYCKIRRLLPGGPAIKSKLIKENDRIVAVAQSNQPPVDIVDMSLSKAVQLIRGPKGTEVRLTIIPAGEDAATRKVVSLIRDEIPLTESAAKAKLIELPDARGGTLRLGVIDLPSFYATFDTSVSKDKPEPKSTTVDVAKLLSKLKRENVAGIILDLRHNGGGSLEEAIRLTGLFIKTGPVVQVRETDGTVEEAVDRDPALLYDGPLLVLTSRRSASASEILAGALQDYGRALIVGDASTHGKGTVQSVNQLRPFIQTRDRSLTNDPGALKLTIKKFFRPSGVSTQLKGVVPDIILPSLANESKDIGESALDNPLPWDTIESAKFDHFNLVDPYLAELRKRSAERIAADKDFAYVREDIEQFRERQADKTISLNQQQRLEEQEEAEARQKARNEERLARQEPPEKVYELTLEQASLPGLPPPVTKTNTALAKLSPPAASGDPGASTTSAAADTPAPDNPQEAEPEQAPATDAALAEAEQILIDYLSLLPKGRLTTAGN